MSKKTFLSNLELQITQKIQLHFPRGVISPKVLNYWDNCKPNIFTEILLKIFGNIPKDKEDDNTIMVDRTIQPNFPHGEGHFLYHCVTPPYSRYHIDIFYVHRWSVTDNKHYSTKELLEFVEKNKGKNQMVYQFDYYDLYAILLKGKDFFLKQFSVPVLYGLRGTAKSNNDLYVPALRIGENGELELTWYSSWNNLSYSDQFGAFAEEF